MNKKLNQQHEIHDKNGNLEAIVNWNNGKIVETIKFIVWKQ